MKRVKEVKWLDTDEEHAEHYPSAFADFKFYWSKKLYRQGEASQRIYLTIDIGVIRELVKKTQLLEKFVLFGETLTILLCGDVVRCITQVLFDCARQCQLCRCLTGPPEYGPAHVCSLCAMNTSVFCCGCIESCDRCTYRSCVEVGPTFGHVKRCLCDSYAFCPRCQLQEECSLCNGKFLLCVKCVVYRLNMKTGLDQTFCLNCFRGAPHDT